MINDCLFLYLVASRQILASNSENQFVFIYSDDRQNCVHERMTLLYKMVAERMSMGADLRKDLIFYLHASNLSLNL